MQPPESSPRLRHQPFVAVVTPSFNQARFLRQAIESVLGQGYPAIEYLVVDGGSTDGSVDILQSYGDRLRWISEPDRGQSDAIAKGFARTRGEILAWLNSDDELAPGAVESAVEAFGRHPEVGLIYGNGDLLDENGHVTGPFPWIESFDLWRLIYFSDYILQPATFFRRSAYDAARGLDTSLHWAMDWDLWIRLAAVSDVAYLPETLGLSRVWSDTKTSTGGWRRILELSRLSRRWTGRPWTTAVQRYALDTLAQKTRRWLPRRVHAPAEFVGRRVDAGILRRMPAQADGWLGPRGHLVFPRRWQRARLVLEVDRIPPRQRSRLRLDLDGRLVATRRIEQPGELVFELTAAAGTDPFCHLDLRADFSFPGPDGRRRVAARRRSLAPL
jgi:GT2 family glycosyltransferase